MLGKAAVAALIGLATWLLASLVPLISTFAVLVGLLVGLAVYFLSVGL